MNALLALEDGRTFPCRSFTGPGSSQGEVVFNTSMTGYQEVLTDPSYRGQMVTMTYPLVGNYGVNLEDVESDRIQVAAFLVREYQAFPSNFRSRSTLADYLTAHGVMGVEGLDTRALTRHIRNSGAMRAVLTTDPIASVDAVGRAKAIPKMEGLDLASTVSTPTPFRWTDQGPEPIDPHHLDGSVWRDRGKRHSVVAMDFGIKYNILRCMAAEGLEVVVVPGRTDAETLKRLDPGGIFLSNGPGDPEPLEGPIETIRQLIGYRPLFGICLGHQLMGLALGGRTFKLKFGHRGANQPVKNLRSGRIEVTSQNHGFAVAPDSLSDKDVEITHINLNDNTLEGFRHRRYPMVAVQYHPEAAPGPHDARYLFTEFKQLMDVAGDDG
ncbi:MAG: glutamine-hydrolyzing carbamoyl-phosphate synthase small subunit [Desulfobacterales bacterium]|jgi:carbamoyl-phosphate synthase small subunit